MLEASVRPSSDLSQTRSLRSLIAFLLALILSLPPSLYTTPPRARRAPVASSSSPAAPSHPSATSPLTLSQCAQHLLPCPRRDVSQTHPATSGPRCSLARSPCPPLAFPAPASPSPTRSRAAHERQRCPFHPGPSDRPVHPPADTTSIATGYAKCSAQRCCPVFKHPEARTSQRANVATDWWGLSAPAVVAITLTDVLTSPDHSCRSSRRADGQLGTRPIGVRECAAP